MIGSGNPGKVNEYLYRIFSVSVTFPLSYSIIPTYILITRITFSASHSLSLIRLFGSFQSVSASQFPLVSSTSPEHSGLQRSNFIALTSEPRRHISQPL